MTKAKTLSATIVCMMGLWQASVANALEFLEAKPIHLAPPNYPVSQRALENAGMVEVRFMVDKDGKVFEPMVIEATKQAFEREALQAAINYLYTPAKLDGSLTESVRTLRVLFLMENSQDTVPKKFGRYHRLVKKELAKDKTDEQKIRSYLRRMTTSNPLSPYAYAHLNLIKYQYALKTNDNNAQISAIRQLLLFEGSAGRKGKFLDDDLRKTIKRALYILYVKTQRYAEALGAYKQLLDIDAEAESLFGDSAKKIYGLRQNDRPVKITMQVDSRGYSSIDLFKKTFSFDDLDGSITTLKLRCRNKFAKLDFNFEREYQIPHSWGYCNLQVIGAPATKFSLFQH